MFNSKTTLPYTTKGSELGITTRAFMAECQNLVTQQICNNIFDLQKTFENKIETIVSEIDGTQTARARKKFFLHYFDLQVTFENKIGTTDVATDTSIGSVATSTAVSEGKKKGTQPQTPRPLSEKSRVHIHTSYRVFPVWLTQQTQMIRIRFVKELLHYQYQLILSEMDASNASLILTLSLHQL